MLHELGQIAEVGDDHDFDAVRAEGVANRVGGIVWNRERNNFDIANLKAQAGANVFHALDSLLLAAFCKHSEDFAVCRLGEVCGAIPFALHLPEAARMIGMLVGNQDGVDVLGALAAERFKTPQHFLAAEANVNQESRLPAFEQRGVARTARSEDRNAKRDTTLSVCRWRTTYALNDVRMMANQRCGVNRMVQRVSCAGVS